MNIFLIGYMASGKTTFGRALAEKTRRPFVDLDDFIEEKHGLSVKDIFARHGEEGFRKMERDALEEISRVSGAIIACGGGTPCFHGNIDLINARGLSVWLDAEVPVIVRRLVEENHKRPLMAGKSPREIEETVRAHLAWREPFYSRAKIRWDSSRLENEEEIRTNIENFLSSHSFVFSAPFI